MKASVPHKKLRYQYFYRAKVLNNKDPKKIGRVILQIPEVMGELESAWAFPVGFSYGGDSEVGELRVPEIGSFVMSGFESGDVNKPFWFGTWWKEGETPKIMTGEGLQDTAHQAPKGTDSFTLVDGRVVTEPEVSYKAEYPQNKAIKTKSGHILEFDDTEGGERINIHHKSGTYTEILPDGKAVSRCRGNKYEVVEGKKNVHVKNESREHVDGQKLMHSNDVTTITSKLGMRLASTMTHGSNEYSCQITFNPIDGGIVIEAPISITLRAAGKISLESAIGMIAFNNKLMTGL